MIDWPEVAPAPTKYIDTEVFPKLRKEPVMPTKKVAKTKKTKTTKRK